MQQDKNFIAAVILSAVVSSISSIVIYYMTITSSLLEIFNYSWLPIVFFSLLIVISIICVNAIKGIRAAAMSVFISLVISCALSFSFALLIFSGLLLPAFYISFLLSIVAINKNNNEIRWLPLSTILLNICIISVLAVILIVSYIDIHLSQPLFSNDSLISIQTSSEQYIKTIISSLDLSQDQLTQLQNFEKFIHDQNQNFLILMLALSISIVSSGLFFILLISIYSVSRFVADKKLSLRPKYFWPQDLVMPMSGLVIFIIAMIASSFTTINYTLLFCLISLAFSFSFGFFVSGLAFIHYKTLGKSWRMIALTLVYIALFSVIFSNLITLLLVSLGIVSTITKTIKNNIQPSSYNS